MFAGDESAFDQIYRLYHGPVFRFAVQMTGSHATSEEILQGGGWHRASHSLRLLNESKLSLILTPREAFQR